MIVGQRHIRRGSRNRGLRLRNAVEIVEDEVLFETLRNVRPARQIAQKCRAG